MPAIPYPLGLRTVIRASKARSQAAAFGASNPADGYAYTQATGADRPTVWDVAFRFDACDATRFQMWFTQSLQRGLLAFTLPIRTEYGSQTLTCRFLPDGLLPAREAGEVWEYTARIVSRG